MPERPPVHRVRCSPRPDAGRRPTAVVRGYDRRWQAARLSYLADHPLCVVCLGGGRTEAATVVDHIVPHRGDVGLFWDRANWQPLCKRCHDRKTATEDGGFGRNGKPATHSDV
jgi:5-methylcytosine-specific restriction protein A